MNSWIYAGRNLKELINDLLSLAFTIVLPAFLLIIMVSLNNKLQFSSSYKPENFVPATIIFSYAFLTMFSGMLIAKDRDSSFLSRMFVSPLKSYNYILGYIIPLLIIAFIQALLLYIIGFTMGLSFTINIIASIPFLLLIALLFIGLGLLMGSILKDQQVGPISSILVQIVAFMSGMWFDLELVGGAFKTIGYILPFAHAVDLIKLVLHGNYSQIGVPMLVICIYVISITLLAIFAFKRNMKR